MEAGNLLRSLPLNPNRHSGHRLPCLPAIIRASSNLKGGYRGPMPKKELLADWVSKNDDAVRSLPIYVGGGSLLAVLFNRTLSGVAPVADASRQAFYFPCHHLRGLEQVMEFHTPPMPSRSECPCLKFFTKGNAKQVLPPKYT